MHVSRVNAIALQEPYFLRGEEEINERHAGGSSNIRGEPNRMVGTIGTVYGAVMFLTSKAAIDEERYSKRVSELLQTHQ